MHSRADDLDGAFFVPDTYMWLPNGSRFVWLGVIESNEWEFRDMSLETFRLFRGNGSFGGKGKGSLEG
jgi:hypothetical protein